MYVCVCVCVCVCTRMCMRVYHLHNPSVHFLYLHTHPTQCPAPPPPHTHPHTHIHTHTPAECPWGYVEALRPSTFPPWYHCGCFRWRLRAAIPSFSSPLSVCPRVHKGVVPCDVVWCIVCSVLQSVLQYLHPSVLSACALVCAKVWCRVLQCGAVRCSVLQSVRQYFHPSAHCARLYVCAATKVWCSMVLYGAMCCCLL